MSGSRPYTNGTQTSPKMPPKIKDSKLTNLKYRNKGVERREGGGDKIKDTISLVFKFQAISIYLEIYHQFQTDLYLPDMNSCSHKPGQTKDVP